MQKKHNMEKWKLTISMTYVKNHLWKWKFIISTTYAKTQYMEKWKIINFHFLSTYGK